MKVINFLRYLFYSLFIPEIPLRIFFDRILRKEEFFQIEIPRETVRIKWVHLLQYIKSRRNGWIFYKNNKRFFAKNRDNIIISSKKFLKIIFATAEDYERLYHHFDFREKNVIDVGGYIGETAILFKKWGAKKVYVFEPLPENFEDILYNLEINGYKDSIRVFKLAVGWNGKKRIKI